MLGCRGRGPVRRMTFAAMAVVLAAGTVCRAERPPAESIFPRNTAVFLTVANAPDLKDRLAQTSIGLMGQDPQLKPLVRQLYGNLADAFATVESQVGASLDELLAIPRGEFAVGVIANEAQTPTVVVALDVGDGAAVVDRMLERGAQALVQSGASQSEETVDSVKLTIFQFASDPPREVVWCKHAGTLLAGSSGESVKQVLALAMGKEGETLAQDPEYAAIRQRCGAAEGTSAQVLWYVDPMALAKSVVANNQTAKFAIDFFAPKLGLDGFLAAGGGILVATEQYDVLTHVHLLLDNPRRGVLKALAVRDGDSTPPRWLPADSAAYSCLHWNFKQTFDEVGKMVDSIQGMGAFAGFVQDRLGARLGVDVEKELLPALSGRLVMGAVVERPASIGGQGTIVALGLEDGKAFEPIVEKLLLQFPGRFEKKMYGGQKYYLLNDAIPGPNEASPRHVCFGIMADDLVAADRENLFQQAIIVASDPDKSLAGGLEFKLVTSRISRLIGKQKPALISFNRPEESMRMLYEIAVAPETRERMRGGRAGRIQLFKSVDQSLKDNPLPPFTVLQQYLAPGGAVLTDDETGLHYISFMLRKK